MASTACALCARNHERWYELPEVQVAICRDCSLCTLRLIAASPTAELERIWLFLNQMSPPEEQNRAELWNAETMQFEPTDSNAMIMQTLRMVPESFLRFFPELAVRDAAARVLEESGDPLDAVGVIFNRRVFLPNAPALLAATLFKI